MSFIMDRTDHPHPHPTPTHDPNPLLIQTIIDDNCKYIAAPPSGRDANSQSEEVH